MSDCLFCKLVAREIPTRIVREDDTTFAFLDISPSSPGHTVVISKYHAPTLIDLPDAERNALFASVKAVDELLVAKIAPDGVTIGINQGAASGQEVGHLHVHLMPRWHNDGGHAVQSVVSKKMEISLDEMAKKLIS